MSVLHGTSHLNILSRRDVGDSLLPRLQHPEVIQQRVTQGRVIRDGVNDDQSQPSLLGAREAPRVALLRSSGVAVVETLPQSPVSIASPNGPPR